jgi:hypothetical protein
MGTYTGAAVHGRERLAADRIRWGVGAEVTGMVSWVVGVALMPVDAKPDKGEQHLAAVLRSQTGQLYAAALLAVLGAVLLVAFVVVLTLLVPEGYPGWALLRVSLAGCVITQTIVACGACFALFTVHIAAGRSAAGPVILGWRALWLTFQASALPAVLLTVTAVLGLRRAGLFPPLVSALGWLSPAAHLLVLFTLARRGAFASDGIIAGLVPLIMVIWMFGPSRNTATIAAGSAQPYRRSLWLTRSSAPPSGARHHRQLRR